MLLETEESLSATEIAFGAYDGSNCLLGCL